MIETGQPVIWDEVHLKRPADGSTLVADVRCFKVGDGVSLSFRDVSARVAARERLASAEARYRALVEDMADVVVVVDPDGRISFVSAQVFGLLGYEPSQLVGQVMRSLVHPEDLGEADRTAAALRSDGRSSGRARLRCADGQYRWIEGNSEVQRDSAGVMTSAISVWRDVTAAHRREAELAMITENVGDVVLHLDGESITWASPSAAGELGEPSGLVGSSVVDHVHHSERTELEESLRRVPDVGRIRHRWRFVGADGDVHWFDVIFSPGPEGRIVMSMRSADAVVADEIALRHMAGSDSLTGLANRRALTGRLSAILDHRRTGEQTAVLYCDLDNLKQINDTAGHGAGDVALLTMARRIREEIRSEDIVARVGGDEFVVVLTGVHSLTEAVTIAEQVRAAVLAPIRLADRSPVTSTVSIGVTLAAADEDPQTLLERADAAMYEAKRSGRNRVVAR